MIDLVTLQTLIGIYKACNNAYELIVTEKVSYISQNVIVPEKIETTAKHLEEALDRTSELIFCMLSISTLEQNKREKSFEILDSVTENIEDIANKLIKLSKKENIDEEFKFIE